MEEKQKEINNKIAIFGERKKSERTKKKKKEERIQKEMELDRKRLELEEKLKAFFNNEKKKKYIKIILRNVLLLYIQ